MNVKKTEVTREDVLPMEQYEQVRKRHRAELVELKKHRRVHCGPHATFYFESYDTMWAQVHEMLYIERGGDEQIADELAAYNPMIPKGRNLSATVMFEIEDKDRRQALLARLGGVEQTFFVKLGNDKIIGRAEEDVDRTSAAGKASSVQFVHFDFTDEQIRAFTDPSLEVVVGIGHPQYNHMAVLSEETRRALAEDFAPLS